MRIIFLKQTISYRKIVKQVKQMGYSVSVVTIHRIQHGKGVILENIRKTGKIGIFPTTANVYVV